MIFLSILIPSLDSRRLLRENLVSYLQGQITNQGITAEILTDVDNGEVSVGTKRDRLLKRAQGEFCCFIDDDDSVVYDYIKQINEKLSPGRCDCMEIQGIMKTDGRKHELFIHSRRYNVWEKRHMTYVRPPNHLNPMRTKFAQQIGFKDMRYGEDKDFSMRLMQAKLLRLEAPVEPNKIQYIYNYNSKK